MNVSQKINDIVDSQNAYDDDITVTDIPNGYFAAVTSNNPPADGGTTRHMTVELMHLEQINESTQTVNSGLYVRQDGEKEVNVKVSQDGTQLAENTQSYN